MEHIAPEMDRITEQTPRSSEIQTSRSPQNTPTEAEVRLLTALINRARALNGWKMQDANTLEKRMLVWRDALKQYRIPLSAYKELFDLAFNERQRKMADGKDVPIEAALLISCWTRPHGLRETIKQREIDAGRTLEATAASQCGRCFGTGLENKFDVDGAIIGIVDNNCDHRPIGESEPMFKPKAAAASNVVPMKD